MERVGWARHNGCGEIVFRQAAGFTVGHSGADDWLEADGWAPLVTEQAAILENAENLARLAALRDCLRMLMVEDLTMSESVRLSLHGVLRAVEETPGLPPQMWPGRN